MSTKLQKALQKAADARKAAEDEMLRCWPPGAQVEFVIMSGQKTPSTGVVHCAGHAVGYLRVKHDQAKPRSRYAYRDVHHTQMRTVAQRGR